MSQYRRRPSQGARGQYFEVHENVAYDIEVDTHAHTVEENVAKIKQSLSK